MKVEIEIPDPPDGWVYDGFRQTKECDLVWTGSEWRTPPPLCYMYHVAVKSKPLWTPSPEMVAMLQRGWVVRDKDNRYRLHCDKPEYCESGYHVSKLGGIVIDKIVRRDQLPPDSIPWDKCCFWIGGDE